MRMGRIIKRINDIAKQINELEENCESCRRRHDFADGYCDACGIKRSIRDLEIELEEEMNADVKEQSPEKPKWQVNIMKRFERVR